MNQRFFVYPGYSACLEIHDALCNDGEPIDGVWDPEQASTVMELRYLASRIGIERNRLGELDPDQCLRDALEALNRNEFDLAKARIAEAISELEGFDEVLIRMTILREDSVLSPEKGKES